LFKLYNDLLTGAAPAFLRRAHKIGPGFRGVDVLQILASLFLSVRG